MNLATKNNSKNLNVDTMSEEFKEFNKETL